jgi:DNA polymerase-4
MSTKEEIKCLNLRYGKNTVYFGGTHNALNSAPMRIALNHITDLIVEDDGSIKTSS